jgi:hypothetical protein
MELQPITETDFIAKRNERRRNNYVWAMNVDGTFREVGPLQAKWITDFDAIITSLKPQMFIDLATQMQSSGLENISIPKEWKKTYSLNDSWGVNSGWGKSGKYTIKVKMGIPPVSSHGPFLEHAPLDGYYYEWAPRNKTGMAVSRFRVVGNP